MTGLVAWRSLRERSVFDGDVKRLIVFSIFLFCRFRVFCLAQFWSEF